MSPPYKQLEVKTNQTSLLCGNRNGHPNTELRTYSHIIGQHKKTKTMSNTDPTKNLKTPAVLLIYTVKFGIGLGSDRGKKPSM